MQKKTNDHYPHYAALEITRSCNMKCIHCGSSADTSDRQNALSLKEWFKVIDELKELGTKAITLSGGEPFVHPDWRDIVRHIATGNRTNTSSTLISNGSCVSDDDIIFMRENGVTHLGISIDGTEKTHDHIRQHPGSYKKILKTINSLHKHKMPVVISTSINKFNFGEMREMLKNMLGLDLAIWQIQVVNSFGRAGEMKDKMIIDREQYAELCENISKWSKEYASKLRITGADSIGYCDGGIVDELLEGAEWMGCSAGIYNIGVESNGNVKGCLSLQDDKFIAGNVRENSLIDIWNNDDVFWYTRGYDPEQMAGSCKHCNKAEQCKAGCLGMAYSVHGSIYENSYCYKDIRGL